MYVQAPSWPSPNVSCKCVGASLISTKQGSSLYKCSLILRLVIDLQTDCIYDHRTTLMRNRFRANFVLRCSTKLYLKAIINESQYSCIANLDFWTKICNCFTYSIPPFSYNSYKLLFHSVFTYNYMICILA